MFLQFERTDFLNNDDKRSKMEKGKRKKITSSLVRVSGTRNLLLFFHKSTQVFSFFMYIKTRISFQVITHVCLGYVPKSVDTAYGRSFWLNRRQTLCFTKEFRSCLPGLISFSLFFFSFGSLCGFWPSKILFPVLYRPLMLLKGAGMAQWLSICLPPMWPGFDVEFMSYTRHLGVQCDYKRIEKTFL